MLLVSFVLPCYNTEPYIRECIDSLYRQGFNEDEFEVICVNNATTDNLESIVKDEMLRHTNIVYVKLDKNIYSGGAYNSGIKVAKGKYLCFVDSDDALNDNSIPMLIRRMEENNLELLQLNIEPFGCGFGNEDPDDIGWNSNSKIDYGVLTGIEYLTLYKEKNLAIPAYRRIHLHEFITKNNLSFKERSVGCDQLFAMQEFKAANRIGISTKKAYKYRYNPTGITKLQISPERCVFYISNHFESYCEIMDTSLSNDVKSSYARIFLDSINSLLVLVNNYHFSDRVYILSSLNTSGIYNALSKKGYILKNTNIYLIMSRILGRHVSYFTARLLNKLNIA